MLRKRACADCCVRSDYELRVSPRFFSWFEGSPGESWKKDQTFFKIGLTKWKCRGIIFKYEKNEGISHQSRKLNFFRGVAQLGSALGSGLNHRARRRFFEKSRKPLKTLTFFGSPECRKIIKSSVWPHVWPLTKKSNIFTTSRCSEGGIAHRSGRWDRRFESCHFDQKTAENKPFWLVFGCFSLYFAQKW